MAVKFKLTSGFLEELREAIRSRNDTFLHQQLDKMYPPDIAEILNHLETHESKYIYSLLPEDIAADTLVELQDEVRDNLLEALTSREIAEHIMDNMESDDAADVLGELPDKMQDEVLAHIEDNDAEQASDIADLLNYDENTAGGLMAKELIRVHVNKNVLECVREIRRQAEDIEHIYNIYVVDDNEKLLGLLPVKKMITTPLRTKVKDLYKPDVVFVKTSTPDEEVASIMKKYDLVAIPVVDDSGRLVGRITIDDVVDVIKDEADKDMQMLSGIAVSVDQNDKVISITRARIPWLIVGLAGGIIGSRIIASYEDQIHIHPEMAFFIPLIGAMGGNVGVQSSAIVVQGLANNTILTDNMVPRLLKELSVGLINGIICSSLILLYNLFASDSLNLSLTVSTALMTVIMFSSFLGTFVPLMLNRLKMDPALATGPFVTTMNDILGIAIYFLVGRLMYGV